MAGVVAEMVRLMKEAAMEKMAESQTCPYKVFPDDFWIFGLRRSQWVERLALTTLWLMAATGRPQLAPEKMLLVAEHVAAAESLGGAGLMRGVAQMTVHAYLGRRAAE